MVKNKLNNAKRSEANSINAGVWRRNPRVLGNFYNYFLNNAIL